MHLSGMTSSPRLGGMKQKLSRDEITTLEEAKANIEEQEECLRNIDRIVEGPAMCEAAERDYHWYSYRQNYLWQLLQDWKDKGG